MFAWDYAMSKIAGSIRAFSDDSLAPTASRRGAAFYGNRTRVSALTGATRGDRAPEAKTPLRREDQKFRLYGAS
jgi:hypothetical protein